MRSLHVPLLLVVLYAAGRTGWAGRVEVLWVAGTVAVAGGLLFGRLESAVHTRLRPLAKRNPSDLTLRPGRILAHRRAGRTTPG